MSKKEENVWAQVGRYTSLMFLLPLGTLIGYAIGYLLDKAFHTKFLAIVFLILGSVAGVIGLLRELNEMTKE